MRGAILFTLLLLAPEQTASVFRGSTRTPAVAGDPIKLQETLDTFGAKQDNTALSPLAPKSRANGVLSLSNNVMATQPIYYASKLGGVVADTGVDQSANLNAAMATLPAVGGKLLLPCGNITVAYPLVLSVNRVTLASADNAYCSHLNAATTFLTGNFLTITGVYSGVEGVAFDVLPTAGQVTSNNTAFRTSGFTVSMRGGYNFLTRASMRGCFVCVEMASTGNYGLVRDVLMEYIADGNSNPGSGGIDVNNQGVGPENWIENVYILPNYGASTIYHPAFGIRLVNSGATHLWGNDITATGIGLSIIPGTGQKVEATFSNDNVWDAVQTNCVYIAPSGTGYVFHTTFTNDWCSSITASANGVMIAGAASTGDPSRSGGTPSPIMNTKWIGGVISSTAGQTGTGFLVADSNSRDSSLIDATVSGWQFGFNLAAGASHVTIAENSIGNYGFYDVPAGGLTTSRTNAIGGNVASGTGDWINIHDNRFFGNTAAFGFAAIGRHSRVHDNPGYNPVGTAAVLLGVSPATFENGPTAADLYIYGAAVTAVSINGSVLCLASPCMISVQANQSVVIIFPGAVPTVVKSVH